MIVLRSVHLFFRASEEDEEDKTHDMSHGRGTFYLFDAQNVKNKKKPFVLVSR